MGVKVGRATFFAWLGVTQYISAEASYATLSLVSRLELTGPGGATRFLWSRLFDLRRTQNVVTVRSMPAKTTLLFVGRLIGDELYAAIEQHIRMASATAQGAPES